MSSKRKQSDAAFKPTDDQLRWFAFANDQQRSDAEMVATLYREGYDEEADRLLAVIGRSPQTLRLVADAWEGTRAKSDLKQTGVNIVRAWIAACEAKGFNFDSPTLFVSVTLFEVRRAYARLFVKERQPRDETVREWLKNLAEVNKIPRHGVFKATLRRCSLSFREDRCRRPRKRIRS
jgi:hypothetical protein